MAYSSNKEKTRGFYEAYPKSVSNRILAKLYTHFMHISGHPCANIDEFLCNNGNPQDLQNNADLHTVYNTERSVLELRSLRQASALFSKNADYGSEVVKEATAWNTFCKTEINCKQINERYRSHEVLATRPDSEAILFYARMEISRVLGNAPDLADLRLDFGPGASAHLQTKQTNAISKLGSLPTVNKSALSRLQDLWDTVPLLAFAHKGRCRLSSGVLTFVPKNAKTHRSIMIEPSLNTFVQKGIGSYMKDLLKKRAGIDLKDQNINRKRARIGSITGEYATVDMSSASDNIAYAVVLDLLPNDWFELLSAWRTSSVSYEKKNISFELEKFSSMGNGFTFELESLIFYSLAYGVAIHRNQSPDISVFGDDVILPSTLYEEYASILQELGFEVNLEKSYYSGPFRESCGADFYEGTNIRPFYVKDRLSDARVISFLNFYREDTTLVPESLRCELLGYVEKKNLLIGPPSFGDGHLHDDSYIPARHGREHGLSLYTFKTWQKKPRRCMDVTRIGEDLYPSFSIYRKEVSNSSSMIRDFLRNYTLHKVLRSFLSDGEMTKVAIPIAPHGLSGLPDDPFSVRGGLTARAVKIYYHRLED